MSRGFHLVTDEVVDGLPEMGEISVGLAARARWSSPRGARR